MDCNLHKTSSSAPFDALHGSYYSAVEKKSKIIILDDSVTLEKNHKWNMSKSYKERKIVNSNKPNKEILDTKASFTQSTIKSPTISITKIKLANNIVNKPAPNDDKVTVPVVEKKTIVKKVTKPKKKISKLGKAFRKYNLLSGKN
ncbi:hypothetical protein SNEBB_009423 [Seison nebaliae]|nr:hypothetical protein SNEBB_009423 [Seison nebaliae]